MTDAQPLIDRRSLLILVAGEAVSLAIVAFVRPDRQFVVGMGVALAFILAGLVYRAFRPKPGMWKWSQPGVSRAPMWLMVLVGVVVMVTIGVACRLLGAGGEDGWLMVQICVMAWTPLNRWWAMPHPPSAPEPST